MKMVINRMMLSVVAVVIAQSALAQFASTPGGSPVPAPNMPPEVIDRLAEVLARLDRLADRLDRQPSEPQPPWQRPQNSGPWFPQPNHHSLMEPPQPNRPHMPPALPRPMPNMGPRQVPSPLLREMLQGRERQLAEMREMFESRTREMAEGHARQMAEMQQAIEARDHELARTLEQSHRRFEEMAERIELLEREVDRLHAQLHEPSDHDDDHEDEEEDD